MNIKKLLNFRVLALFLSVLVMSSSLSAEAIETEGEDEEILEMQELRLAKAELALVDGNKAQALNLLKDNITRKNFHLDTYMLLAKIHFQNRDYARGFRAYYYAIRKLHSDKLYRSHGKYLKYYLNKLPRPNEKAMDLYEAVANKYYDLFENKQYPSASNELLLSLAYKYFSILESYDYKTANTKYMLGRISQKLKNYNIAIEKIMEAKDLFIKADQEAGLADATYSDLDYDIGDMLIQQGRLDAGSIFLKTLYLGDKTNPALKEYAKVYLDSISQNFTATTITYGFTDYGNLYSLNQEVVDSKSYQSALTKITATTHVFAINVFQSSKRWNDNWQFFGSGNFLKNTFKDTRFKSLDSQTLSLSFDIRYDNLKNSLAKIGYAGTMSYERGTDDDGFEKNALSHYFYAQYSHTFRFGLLSFKTPLTLNDNVNTNDTYDFGLDVTLTPYLINRFWSPSYSINVSSIGEDFGVERSLSWSAALSNHLRLSDYSSVFFEPSYSQYSNTDTSYNFYQVSFSLSWSVYLVNFWGISQTLSSSFTKRFNFSGSVVNIPTSTLTWSYNF